MRGPERQGDAVRNRVSASLQQRSLQELPGSPLGEGAGAKRESSARQGVRPPSGEEVAHIEILGQQRVQDLANVDVLIDEAFDSQAPWLAGTKGQIANQVILTHHQPPIEIRRAAAQDLILAVLVFREHRCSDRKHAHLADLGCVPETAQHASFRASGKAAPR